MHGFLPFSKVVPNGFLKEYMGLDLNGFVGHLNELIPTLFAEDPIYGVARRTNLSQGSNGQALGIFAPEEALSNQYRWWNSETQANWLDGFIRTAILLQNEEMLAKAKGLVDYYLSTQDSDGYLGIYQEDLRFKTGKENGELWAQSMLLRALFAYYEYSSSDELLLKIRAAANRILLAFPINSDARPFSNANEPVESFCTGIGHGLTITDIFFWLYKATGETLYRDYCSWLYKQFNLEGGSNLDGDVMVRNLKDPSYRMAGHSVHTYEQVRALALAAFLGNNESLRDALTAYWEYVDKNLICPSGAAIGDECINSIGVNATTTGYEYCGLHELLHSYSLMLELTADPEWADRMERLFFNAAMGAHLPNESAITYCQTDNCYELSGKFQTIQPHCRNIEEQQTRYKYSPTHQDVAVCCVPNAGRILPYYCMSMYALQGSTITKNLYGPSIMEIQLNGTIIQIEETSNYPFETYIVLRVKVSRPIRFSFQTRVPGWSKKIEITGMEYTVCGRMIRFECLWEGTTDIKIHFHREPVLQHTHAGEAYISLGGLTMALEIASESRIVREYPLDKFYDRHFFSLIRDYDVRLCVDKPITETHDGLYAWFVNVSTSDLERRLLVPMGKTILRRVTFPVN